VQEGNDQDTRVLIPLHLTAPPETGHSATVNYRTIAGTATAGEDYVATSGIASISSGTEGTIEVLIHGDRKREPNETFTIEISSAFYASIGRSSATVTIVDDDANALAPTTTTLALSNASITYGETIRLSAAATPASAGMPAPSGAVTFAADGHSIGTVALTNGAAAMETDVLPAGSHSFTASYGGDTTNDVSTSVPLIAIVAKAGTSVAYSSTPKVSAGDPVTIRAEVRRDEQAEQRATGSVSVSDAGHILAEQSVSHGAATLTIVGLASGSHQLLITYSGDGNLTPSSVMMSEEVALPVLSISVTSVAEGNAGVSTPVMLTVALSAPSTEVVRVAFGTIDGTARTGEDYEPVHGIVEFAPGEMLKRVEVDVIGDNVPEADETFFLVLSDPRNATIDVPSAIVIIANDDQVPPRRRPSRH
jgi:hypothetical protein